MKKNTFKKCVNNLMNDLMLLENLESLKMESKAKENVAVRMRVEINKLIRSYRGN